MRLRRDCSLERHLLENRQQYRYSCPQSTCSVQNVASRFIRFTLSLSFSLDYVMADHVMDLPLADVVPMSMVVSSIELLAPPDRWKPTSGSAEFSGKIQCAGDAST